MTGFSLLPTTPEEGPDEHHLNFKGQPHVLGPKWTHLPTITIGLLGVQMFWSVEMSYGVCDCCKSWFEQFLCSFEYQLRLIYFLWVYQNQAWLLSS